MNLARVWECGPLQGPADCEGTIGLQLVGATDCSVITHRLKISDI